MAKIASSQSEIELLHDDLAAKICTITRTEVDCDEHERGEREIHFEYQSKLEESERLKEALAETRKIEVVKNASPRVKHPILTRTDTRKATGSASSQI